MPFGAAGGHLRPGPRRPADLLDRPLQPPLHLLHARARHDLPAPSGPALLRRDRPGRLRGPCRGGRCRAAHRWRAAGAPGARPIWSAGCPELGFADVSLTTNGMLLAPALPALVAAGLTRVNVSCDSLRPERFAAIRRRGDLATVLASMDAAEAAGLPPVKVNVVLESGSNDDEILDVRRVRPVDRSDRPVHRVHAARRPGGLASASVWSRGRGRAPDRRAVAPGRRATGPTTTPRRSGSGSSTVAGEIGVISSVTQPFCGTCNRLRLTADGAVRNCLFSDDELDVRRAARGGADRRAIERQLRLAVWGKRPGHGIDEPGFLRPARSMSMIGG